MDVAGAVRVLVALGSGALLAQAFPPRGWWWAAPLAVALLTLASWRRSAWAGLGLGFVSGTVFFALLVRWLSVVGDDAWLLLSLYCGLWIGFACLGTALVTRLPWWPAWVAGVWALEEALRDRVPFGGFPWGRLAYAETSSPLTPLAALVGTPGLTAATALCGALLAYAVLRLLPRAAGTPRWGEPAPRSWLAGAGSLVGAAALVAVGAVVPLPTDGETFGGPAGVTAAVVQGNVPELGLDFNAQRRAVLDNHVRETEKLAAEVKAGLKQAPDIVIWPENSSDLDPYTQADARERIDAAVDAIGAPTLVGAVVVNQDDPSTILNVGIVWDPKTGPGARYVKRHPVPFGEYVPFRSLLAPLITRFDRVPRDFAPGSVPGLLPLGPALVGDVICFEVAYDQEVRDVVMSGARLLVVQTNNATYGRTGQPEQQLAMSRLRAVEHGRTVLVAATSGISAVVLPDGSVAAELPEFTAGSLVRTVPLRDSRTVADRIGVWGEVGLALLGLVGMVWAGLRRGIRSAPEPSQEAPQP